MLYREIVPVTRHEAERARSRKDPELYHIVVAVGLHERDGEWAEAFCLDLGTSANPLVRANAILALGHLARRFRKVSPAAIAMVATGLTDEQVRGAAESTADDIEQFTTERVRPVS